LIYFISWIYPNEFFISLMHRFLAIYIVVIGLNILIGLSGQLSLGHAGFYALGAYGSGLLANHLGLPFWVTMWGGVILVLGCGCWLSRSWDSVLEGDFCRRFSRRFGGLWGTLPVGPLKV